MNGNLKNLLFGKRLIIIVGIMLTLVAAPVGILTMRQYMDAEATTETVDYETLKELIEPNRDKDPVKLSDNDKLTIPTNPNSGVSYQLESLTYNASTGEMATVPEGVALLHLPVKDVHDNKALLGDDDMVIYRGTNFDIAVDASAKGFASYIVALNENAPTSYDFGVDLPSGYKLSEDGDGGVEVLNDENDVVGVIEAPWAVDSNGESVPTQYKLRGGALVQTLQHSGASYPVVADPDYEFGWTHISVLYDLGGADDWEDEIDDADDFISTWSSAVCAADASLIALLTLIFPPSVPYVIFQAALQCGAVQLSAVPAHRALEDIEDDYLSDPVDSDCELDVELSYIGGYFRRVKLADCGVDFNRFIAP